MVKTDLRDTTFIIPFCIDSQDRIENLIAILKYLHENFDTNFILVENGERTRFFELPNVGAKHVFDPTPNGEFHRTARINVGIRLARTPYISIYDADCIFQEGRIFLAVEALRKGATLSYPYSGDFVDIERSYLSDGIIKKRESLTKDSVGGACFLNREDYIKCGGEREEFQSWCFDDVSRMHIISTLGFTIFRAEGECYHITHWRGENSGPNRFTSQNIIIWNKIKEMNKYSLFNYLQEFNWMR